MLSYEIRVYLNAMEMIQMIMQYAYIILNKIFNVLGRLIIW